MAEQAFSPDFLFSTITNVNFGGMWVGITVAVDPLVSPFSDALQSISANFPGQAGGTPGLPGFVNNVNVDPFPDSLTIKLPAPESHTAAGAGFVGWAVQGALLIQIGSGRLALPSVSFSINCPCSATLDQFGNESGGGAGCVLFTDDQIKGFAGLDVHAVVQDATPCVQRVTRDFFTSFPGPIVFTVNPVTKQISVSGGAP